VGRVTVSFLWEGKPEIDTIFVTRIQKRRFDENPSFEERKFLSIVRIRGKSISRFECVY